MPYLTPDSGGGDYLCRRIRFRAELAGFITGTIERLEKRYNWQEFGTATIDEVTSWATEALTYYLDSGDICMTGQLTTYITATPPDGTLPCEGGTYNRVDYPALYAALHAAFIVDADTFALPDLRGRAVIAIGTGTGLSARAMGDTGGVETVSLTAAQNGAHSHTVTSAAVNATTIGPGAPEPTAIPNPTDTTGSSGAGDAHENMMPFFAGGVAVYT